MKYRVLEILECPRQGGSLALVDAQVKQVAANCDFNSVRCVRFCGLKNKPVAEAGVTPSDCRQCYDSEIISGTLVSSSGAKYPIVNGVPRILTSGMAGFLQKNHDTFSLEWKMFRFGERNWGQDIEFRKNLFLKGMGRTPAELRGQLMFDAGCGSGLLAIEMAKSFGMEVMALDLAGGIEQAYANNSNPFVHFVQASVLEPPLRKRSMNYVYCAGVLVHLPDSKEGFEVVSRCLAPGGRYMIWVYHPIDAKHHPGDFRKLALYNWIRKNITSRLPIRLQYAIYMMMVLPYVAKRTLKNILSHKKDDRTWREKMQGFVDMFSPIYQNRHTEEEVTDWYAKAGFINIAIGYHEQYGFSARGDRPKEGQV